MVREGWRRHLVKMTTMEIPRTISLFSRINIIKNTHSAPVLFYHSRNFSPLSFTYPRRFSMASFGAQSSSAQAVPTGDVNSDANVFQLIKTHQEAAARLSPVEEIRTVLDNNVRGMLSTFSQIYEGYPSGSIVDFACDVDGTPILAVSSVAAHTKDLLANPKCSLLVARDLEDKTDLVVALHGDAITVTEKDKAAIQAAYLAKHPNAFWVDLDDFQFMCIKPKAVQYVSGVATALLGSGEFCKEEYQAAKVDPIAQFSKPVASHMNKDHAEDARLIVQHATSIPSWIQC